MNTLSEDVIAAIRTAYSSWGVPEALMPSGTMNHADLVRILDCIEPSIPNRPCEIAPTSFDANDPELRALPRPMGWRWTSAENALRGFKTRGVMMRLPLFWQVEPALFAAGQSIGVPIFVNDQDNMPVGAAAIQTAGMDTVVTDSADALTFSSFLSGSKSAFPSSWLIVYPISLDTWNIPAPAREANVCVAQEVHLFPGVPLLTQCEHLISTKDSVFHVCDEYLLEQDGLSVTSISPVPLPLLRYKLGTRLSTGGTCVCGKERITQ